MKNLCLILAFLMFCTSAALATVTINTFTTAVGAGTLTTISGYTADAGSNRLLVMSASFEDNSATQPVIDSIKFGSTKATQGPIIFWFDISGRRMGIYLWYWLDADIESGSQDAVVTWGEAPQNNETVLSIVTFEGVDQTTPFADSDSASLNNTLGPITNSVSGSASNMTVYFTCYGRGGGAWTQNNGASEGWDLTSTGGGSQFSCGFLLNLSTPSATATGVSADRAIGMTSLVIAASGAPPAAPPSRRRKIMMEE